MDIIKRILIETFSSIVKTEEFILSSGQKSTFYIDCKEVLLDHVTMKLIVDCIWKTKCRWLMPNIHSVAGITSGADPIVCGMVNYYWKNGLFIRQKQKEHGTKKLIEGRFKEGDTVIIVDDVLTTGDSIKYAYDTLVKHKLEPKGIVVLVDRQENDAVAVLEKYTSIPVLSITTKEEIFSFLNKKSGGLPIKDIVIKYIKDNGYDGLYHEKCAGCNIKDFLKCEEIWIKDCKPGYKHIIHFDDYNDYCIKSFKHRG